MVEITQCVTDTRVFILPKTGSCRMFSLRMMAALLMTTALLMTGCNDAGDSVAFNGNVRLDGVPVSSEIQIEQLDVDGNRVGRSATAYADDSGDFSAVIEPASTSRPLDCRIVVRSSEVGSSGLLSAFDEKSGPSKVTRLQRAIRDGDSLAILLTR